ncbi:MAG: hypothetical protein Ct9H300mP11_18440 [Chloroflexota bacterium]|nr:MAG: hypothetical protein Ct9H300mP11_18440 [Chloroflexota bacterium]
MSTHLFGLTSRTFKHSHAIGRAEFAGRGFFRILPTWQSLPTVLSMFENRSYENRPDGVHVTVENAG